MSKYFDGFLSKVYGISYLYFKVKDKVCTGRVKPAGVESLYRCPDCWVTQNIFSKIWFAV